jgi:hypothetical protein
MNKLKMFFVAILMFVSSIANAGLINISDGSFDLSSGAVVFDNSSSSIDLVPPADIFNVTGDFVSYFVDTSSFTLDSLSTTGGSFIFGEFWDFSNGVTPLFLSLVVNYDVDLFDGESMLMSGTAQLINTLNISEFIDLDFSGLAAHKFIDNNPSNTRYAFFEGSFSTIANNNPGGPGVSVPEPSTLAIFALGMFGLVARKKEKVLV